MLVMLTGGAGSYAQFITVLVVFVLVLAVTAAVTKWLAGYQKQQSANCNIEVLETTRISTNKYIQIVRVGETYMVLAVCKDTVTMLGQVSAEELKRRDFEQGSLSFKTFLEHTIKKDSSNRQGTKEDVHEDKKS